MWIALADLLGRDAKGLAAVPPSMPAAARMFRVADAGTSLFDMVPLAAPAGQVEPVGLRARDEPDEVDRLFGVGPSD